MTEPYVINLDRRTERWEWMQESWKGIFKLTRVSAIETTPGGVGCSLSHIKVVEEAKARGDPCVLVWEDDCKPRRHPRVIKALWDEVLPQLTKHSEKWDVVLGATSRVRMGATKNIDLSTKNVGVYDLPHGFTTHWTLYNSSAYDTLIKWKDVREPQNDIYLFQKFRVKVVVPFLADQRIGFSDLTIKEEDYQAWFDSAESEIMSI